MLTISHFYAFPVLSKPTREEKVSGRQELSGEKNAENVFFTREGIRQVLHNLYKLELGFRFQFVYGFQTETEKGEIIQKKFFAQIVGD